MAISEHIGGSVEGFADIMNKKAKDLGLVNSHFVTPHGLDNDEHYSTAYDMAILTNYALNNDKFREIVGVKTTTIMIGNNPRTISNTNELLGNVDGVYGVKTGFTGNAGRCLITSCKKENLDIIIVVLGADTKKIRGLDTRNIITYVFANYEMVDTYDLVKEAFDNFCKNKNITVKKSLSTTELMIKNKESYIYPINKNEIKNLRTAIYSVIGIDTTVKSGSKIGVLNLKCNDKILYSLDILLKNEVQKMSWKDYMKMFLKNYINYFDLYV